MGRTSRMIFDSSAVTARSPFDRNDGATLAILPWLEIGNTEMFLGCLGSRRGGGGGGGVQVQVPQGQVQSNIGSLGAAIEVPQTSSVSRGRGVGIMIGRPFVIVAQAYTKHLSERHPDSLQHNMADPLSIASGAIAVVSLAIQLVGVTQNCVAFWQSLRTIDDKAKRLQDHLSLIFTIANGIIEVYQEQPNIQCGEAVVKALQSCKERTESLEDLLRIRGPLQGGGVVRRRWSSFKTLLKDKAIVEIESQLRGDVTMLLLALQPFYHQVHRRDLKEIFNASTSAATLTKQRSSEQNTKHQARSSVANTLSLYHNGREDLIQFCNHRFAFKVDSYTIIERIIRAVVNQHGENLLHCAARYAQADLVLLLLDLGVDGAAYGDNLLTPLEHLARKIRMNFAYPSKVVNTIRALVERTHCQPLLPLFRSEYSSVNLEDIDSEGWTLLGDAAFNFGWATQLCVDDPPLGWQTRYLIRAGADLHATSTLGRLTPLDAFLRGCTAHGVDHARVFLDVLRRCDGNLQAYARKEQEMHSGEHLIYTSWDNDLWRWIPTKRRVVYEYGESADQLQIWLEDYDALSWFHCGRFDLEIFLVTKPAQSALRWENICKRDDKEFLLPSPATMTGSEKSVERVKKWKWTIKGLMSLTNHWMGFLMLTLVVNYGFHLYLKFLKF
ncbi:hypothetical protein G7Y89_g4265 [Cudoniella acicularis]|uniref:Fungal N-terminal domain-containing protein n=1 Tax=Cudoniella acicularis TaxID=354080 RepID=A0A8H4W7M3_9HELO|nr:hypothetical protein G7Y89_g4265 [Cudoniella acicularis]